MEHCAWSVSLQEARQGLGDEILQGPLGFNPQAEALPGGPSQAASQLLEDRNSGTRFMKGIILGALLSASMWAGILILVL